MTANEVLVAGCGGVPALVLYERVVRALEAVVHVGGEDEEVLLAQRSFSDGKGMRSYESGRPSGCLCVFEQKLPKPREGELEDARSGLLYYTSLEQALHPVL